LQNVSVTFAKGTILERQALKSINLTVNEGDFITVIGNNGAGKSTIQGVIAGTVIADSGDILIDNESIIKQNTYKRSRFIARVFQDPRTGTSEQLSIEENMSLAANRGTARNLNFAITNVERQFFAEKLSHLNMNLENRLTDLVGSLSGGQRQALSLVMATLAPAKLLLLDEHTSALDPKMAETIMQLTNKIVEENNLTVLMVTHNIEHALFFGNRTIMLKEGRIAYDLTKEERSSFDPRSLLSVY
jgi:putative ABC transport system ATP-binding protein